MKDYSKYVGQKMGKCTLLGVNHLVGDFLCYCGNSFSKRISEIKSGRVASCGCLVKERNMQKVSETLFLGELLFNRNGAPFATKVIKQDNKKKYKITFIETGHQVILSKRPYNGIGILKFNSKISDDNMRKEIHSRAYRCYLGIFERSGKHANYLNTRVSPDWYNYENFLIWYENNYPIKLHNEKIHLDKDLLSLGNPEYCPATCCLIPAQINLKLKDKAKIRRNKNGTYIVVFGNTRHKFGCLKSATLFWKDFKKNELIKTTELFSDHLEEHILSAISGYEFKNITVVEA